MIARYFAWLIIYTICNETPHCVSTKYNTSMICYHSECGFYCNSDFLIPAEYQLVISNISSVIWYTEYVESILVNRTMCRAYVLKESTIKMWCNSNMFPSWLNTSIILSAYAQLLIFTVLHYGDVIMRAMAFQITDVSIIHPTVCWGADQRKHQSSASLAFVRGIHRWPVKSSHKGPVMWKVFPFNNVIMYNWHKCMLHVTIPGNLTLGIDGLLRT